MPRLRQPEEYNRKQYEVVVEHFKKYVHCSVKTRLFNLFVNYYLTTASHAFYTELLLISYVKSFRYTAFNTPLYDTSIHISNCIIQYTTVGTNNNNKE